MLGQRGGEVLVKIADALAALGLDPGSTPDQETVRRFYANGVMRDHPDHGGTGSLLATLKAARDTLLYQDAIPPCKYCAGSGKVRFRFGVQACTACGGSGDQP
jgi:hypothetical protein